MRALEDEDYDEFDDANEAWNLYARGNIGPGPVQQASSESTVDIQKQTDRQLPINERLQKIALNEDRKVPETEPKAADVSNEKCKETEKEEIPRPEKPIRSTEDDKRQNTEGMEEASEIQTEAVSTDESKSKKTPEKAKSNVIRSWSITNFLIKKRAASSPPENNPSTQRIRTEKDTHNTTGQAREEVPIT
jgi:hypothetical protein